MHIIAISSSLRRASTNTGLLRACKKVLPAGNTMEIIVPDLPLFNQDLEGGELPSSVQEFRNKLKTADAMLFSLCEYNYGISGAMKNAIDWGSRGSDGGNLFDGKPAAIISAGGGVGGLRAQQHFRDIALFVNLHIMNKPELMVKIFEQPSPVDFSTGDVVDEETTARCEKVLTSLIAWANLINNK